MGTNIVERKCTRCSGDLQFDFDKKLWICQRCGSEWDQRKLYDNPYSIQNLVRQTLSDITYRRLDSAAKNLIECEKIDVRYVGTLVAKIAYEMVSIMTQGAYSERDVHSAYARLKRDYDLLLHIGKTISDEEEELYWYLSDADIYTTLVLVYDALNDAERRDCIFWMLDVKSIYSEYANANLLSYTLKHKILDMADDILGNIRFLNVEGALTEVLYKYPDSEEKRTHIVRLINEHTADPVDETVVKTYLTSSEDSIETKSVVIEAAVTNGSEVSLSYVVENILPYADVKNTTALLNVYCRRKLLDSDVLLILNFVCIHGDAATAIATMECLKNNGQYVFVPRKIFLAVLLRSDWTVHDRCSILERLFDCKIEAKGVETAVSEYLLDSRDTTDIRVEILMYLWGKIQVLPTSTIQNYILQCTVDKSEKPAVVKMILDKCLNMSVLNELLSKYLHLETDPDEVKAQIADILTDRGLRLDPASIISYLCYPHDDVPTKIHFINKILANGSRLRSDTASIYLEQTSPELFSPELFSLIFEQKGDFSARAFERYLLYCRDFDKVKAQRVQLIADNCSDSVGAMRCQIVHMGNSINCGLLQAYILMSTDSLEVSGDIVDGLIDRYKMKINVEIMVSGQSMKFKKYAVTMKDKLGDTTKDICERHRVFMKLFG